MKTKLTVLAAVAALFVVAGPSHAQSWKAGLGSWPDPSTGTSVLPSGNTEFPLVRGQLDQPDVTGFDAVGPPSFASDGGAIIRTSYELDGGTDDCCPGACDQESCCGDEGCGGGGCVCCGGSCLPRCQVFGDFLWMRPRSAKVTYAVPFNGGATPPAGTPVQVGRTAIVDPQFEAGFRVGFAKAIDCYASLGATYTRLETGAVNQITTQNPYVLRSLVIHPSSQNATTDWLDAQASLDLDYHLADIDYRRIIACDGQYQWNYLVGLRYASISQDFRSVFTSVGTEAVNSEVNFDGGGIRVGLEGERHSCGCCGLLVYGRGAASFVGGEFRARYFQGSGQDPLIAETTWKAGQVVSILDLEIGCGWQSPGGLVRLTGGYMFSSWISMVKVQDFIKAVRTATDNDLDDVFGNTLTFDGLVVRAEVRY